MLAVEGKDDEIIGWVHVATVSRMKLPDMIAKKSRQGKELSGMREPRRKKAPLLPEPAPSHPGNTLKV